MFLPDDYKAPASNKNYMKLVDGENRFRILSAPILGWEDWTADKKPVRFRFNNKPSRPINEKMPVRHFWAFIVFNYADEMIQVMEITQATIRKAIEGLSKDSDWGAPYFYDIKVYRKGEGTDTEYTVTPTPKKPVDPYVIEEFNSRPCNLEALFDNQDPFDPAWASYTQGVFSESDIKKNAPQPIGQSPISIEQVKQLKELIFQDKNTDEAMQALLKRCMCESIERISSDKFDKAFAWLKKRIDDQRALEEVPF